MPWQGGPLVVTIHIRGIPRRLVRRGGRRRGTSGSSVWVAALPAGRPKVRTRITAVGAASARHLLVGRAGGVAHRRSHETRFRVRAPRLARAPPFEFVDRAKKRARLAC